MTVTDKFLLLHLPKTGGTFANKMVSSVYDKVNRNKLSRIMARLKGRYYKKLYIEELISGTLVEYGQHAGVDQIPAEYKKHPKACIIRNPYDFYASNFGFKWWIKNPELTDNLNFTKIKSYPDISFEEMFDYYQELVVEYGRNIGADLSNIGFYTFQFCITCISNPDCFFKEISGKKIRESDNLLKNRVSEITFLKQEDLNLELHSFLKAYNYSAKEINFILKAKKILPLNKGRAEGIEAWRNTINESRMSRILEQDRLIFNCFDHYLN